MLAEKGVSVDLKRGLAQVHGHGRKLLSKRMAALPAGEAMAWVSHIGFYDFDAAGLAKLAASPHLGGLKRLGFRANWNASPAARDALRSRFGTALDA